MSSFSQKGFEVGGWLGTSLYFGDLNTSFQIEPGYAGGLIGRYNFDERISLKGSLNYARIHADDEDSSNFFERARGLDFFSQIVDATAHIEFNFFPYIHGHKELFFTPYLAIGISATHFNPKTSVFDPDLNQSISVSLQPLGTEGQLPGEEYSRFSPGFSIGGGFKFDVSKLWSINIEIATRQVLSDHIDDVSGVYANPDDIDANRSILFGSGISPSDIADPTGNFSAGKQRGNSRDNDSYTFIGIGVLRYFGSLQCPKPSAIF